MAVNEPVGRLSCRLRRQQGFSLRLEGMTTAHRHSELHDLVDQLTPGQADAVRAVVLQLVTNPAMPSQRTGSPSYAPDYQGAQKFSTSSATDAVPKPKRRLSFAGLVRAEPDLAERSEDIIREEVTRRAA